MISEMAGLPVLFYPLHWGKGDKGVGRDEGLGEVYLAELVSLLLQLADFLLQLLNPLYLTHSKRTLYLQRIFRDIITQVEFKRQIDAPGIVPGNDYYKFKSVIKLNLKESASQLNKLVLKDSPHI